MHGNVREWCLDAYPDAFRINRGGDWGAPTGDLRSGRRFADPKDRRAFKLGFRAAVSLPRK